MCAKRITQPVVYIASLLVLVAILFVLPKIYAQVCKSPAADSMARFQGMPRDTNGNIHVKVDYQFGGTVPDPTIKHAMENAIGA